MEFNKLLKATKGGSHEYIFAFLFQCLLFQAIVYTFISFTIVYCFPFSIPSKMPPSRKIFVIFQTSLKHESK